MTAPPPPTPDIVLNANGRKVKGKHTIDLDWSGNNGNVNIFLYGGLVSGDESGNTFTHFTSNKRAAEYAYQVCETASPSSCSNEVTVNY